MQNINDISEFQTFKTNHSYQLRLMSDEEILSKAESVYNAQLLKSREHTLDSSLFGATIMNPDCSVCFQRVEECPGHYSVIQLPFPIVRSICLKDFKTLISLICPICSHFIIPNISDALKIAPEYRLSWIKRETEKMAKGDGSLIKCSVCKNDMTLIKVMQNEPQLRCCCEIQEQNRLEQFNPIYLYTMLQMFSELDEAGFSINYHPKNFMTTVIPIIPSKLRPKTIVSSESTLTTYYKIIIEEICPELNNVYKIVTGNTSEPVVVFDKGDLLNNFNKLYDKLMAYYMLITDMGTDRTKEVELNLIEKRDRKHVDIHNALIGRFKGKERSIFNKGIVATRHNVSARTVLGGATDSPIKCVNVPYHIASKLSMLYPVYAQNLKAMRQLVASMNNTDVVNNINIPHVLGIMNCFTGKLSKITFKDALTKASLLKPGDKIAISLLNGDLVMQSRFPAVREESWGSFQVKKDNNTIITIPLSDCEMKMADFDGDEAQIYISSAHYLDVEALMLHSTFAQYIAYKDGNPAIWFPWTGDAAYGLDKFKQGRKCIIYNGEYTPEYNVIEKIESFLPKDLRYIDGKLEIIDGKLPSEKTAFRNAEFFKYYASLYSAEKAEELMDKLIQLAYDVNIDQGCSLGYEIKIYGKDTKEKIKEIIKETEKKMLEMEMSNNKHKDVLQILTIEGQKSKIKKLLIDGAKGTEIDRMGYTTLRQEEYYQTVVMLDPIVVEGTRIQPVLSEGSRTCVAFPRYSVDPRAYGYVDRGYNNDISPVSHFYETKQQRFALFQKGQGTADQGYMSKRLGVAYGNNYIDFNGAIVNNFQIVGTMYGCCGLNPRLFVKQPLIDINMKREEFMKKYTKDNRVIELYDIINMYKDIYVTFTCFTRSETVKPEFIAGFNYEQYINSHAEKDKSTPSDKINKFIDKLRNFFCPKDLKQKYILENFNHHEYYFRTKLNNYNCSDEILDKLYEMFEWSLADGGDPVGMKAALATSEPLTQASLHAIHHAGGGGANEEQILRSAGLVRFEELLGGNRCKNTVMSFKLYDDSKENCIDFANKQETFYFNNIWTRMELGICQKISDKVLSLHPDLNLQEIEVNAYFITSIWNLTQISSYNIHVVDIINKLIENYNEIMFITGYILNSTEFMAYIYFKSTVKADQIQVLMEEWSMERTSTIVHGKYLRNCFVSENKNNPGHYIVEANEVSPNSMAFQNLIFDPRIDPRGCRTTDPNVNQSMFGVFEASTRQYEELIYTATNLSDTSGVLHRHYKVLADATFSGGDARYASRNSLRHDRTMDTLRLVQFETAKDMIQQSLKFGDIQPIADPVSSSVFGELPTVGTGASKITLYAKE